MTHFTKDMIELFSFFCRPCNLLARMNMRQTVLL